MGFGRVARRLRPPDVGAWSPVEWVQALAALAVPLAVAARTALDPRWWADGPLPLLSVAMAGLLAVAGVRWSRRATQRPRALTSRHRRAVRAAVERRHEQVAAAGRLLAELADGPDDPESLWSAFGVESNLRVPAFLQSQVDPDMAPEALVRYLSARRSKPVAAEIPPWQALTVPLAACVLPAVMLVVFV